MYTESQIKDAYRAYVAAGYASPVVPKLMGYERFAATPDTVAFYIDVAAKVAEHTP